MTYFKKWNCELFLTTTLKMMTANQSGHCILYDCACIIIIVQGCGLKFSNTHGCVWASLCTYNYAPLFSKGANCFALFSRQSVGL